MSNRGIELVTGPTNTFTTGQKAPTVEEILAAVEKLRALPPPPPPRRVVRVGDCVYEFVVTPLPEPEQWFLLGDPRAFLPGQVEFVGASPLPGPDEAPDKKAGHLGDRR